ncbi:MAG: PPC domain-containing protein [Polyangiales bacterium]
MSADEKNLAIVFSFIAIAFVGCDESSGSTSADATKLAVGEEVVDIGSVNGDGQLFSVEVPLGAFDLRVKLRPADNATGDADLYVRFGQEPDIEQASNNDCVSATTGNDEICFIASPKAGTYYILVASYQTFSGVALVAEYSTPVGCTDDSDCLDGEICAESVCIVDLCEDGCDDSGTASCEVNTSATPSVAVCTCKDGYSGDRCDGYEGPESCGNGIVEYEREECDGEDFCDSTCRVKTTDQLYCSRLGGDASDNWDVRASFAQKMAFDPADYWTQESGGDYLLSIDATGEFTISFRDPYAMDEKESFCGHCDERSNVSTDDYSQFCVFNEADYKEVTTQTVAAGYASESDERVARIFVGDRMLLNARGVEKDGVTHIVGVDNGMLWYYRKEAGIWQGETIDAGGNIREATERNLAMALDAAGTIHVAYSTSGLAHEVRYAVGSAGSWSSEAVAEKSGSACSGMVDFKELLICTEALGEDVAIAVDIYDRPTLMYSSGGPEYARYLYDEQNQIYRYYIRFVDARTFVDLRNGQWTERDSFVRETDWRIESEWEPLDGFANARDQANSLAMVIAADGTVYAAFNDYYTERAGQASSLMEILAIPPL